jgi:hypothetical protein
MGGLNPTDMTVFNNEVLFNGADVNGLSGLWATNGTAGGRTSFLLKHRAPRPDSIPLT